MDAREKWFRGVIDDAENEENYEDLDALGYIHTVDSSREDCALVFVIGRHVRPHVHDRERLLRHAMRTLMRLGAMRRMHVVYVNTLASPFENSPGFAWLIYTLSWLPKSFLERVECVSVLHPSLSSVAFWSGLVPIANALLLAAPVHVETVMRVELLPKHAHDVIRASSGEGGVFHFVVEHDNDVLEDHPLNDFGVHVMQDAPAETATK